ncbi:MAG: ABC transporter permease subunit, partial [Nitrospinota bacterium]
PTATLVGTVPPAIKTPPLAVGVDEYREIAYLVTSAGIRFVSLQDGSLLETGHWEVPAGTRIVGVSTLGRGPFALGLSDGHIIPVTVRFEVSFSDGERQITPDLVVEEPLTADPAGRPLRLLSYALTETGPIAAAAIGPQDLVLVFITEQKALIGPGTREERHQKLSLPVRGTISALILDNRGEDLFVGTSTGELVRVDMRDPEEPQLKEIVSATQKGVAISLLGFLLGDRTLVVGDAAGGVSSWQVLREDGGERSLHKIHDFTPHRGPVVAFARSRRDKGFLTADDRGIIALRYGTTGKTLLTLQHAGPPVALSFAPKADGLLAVDARGRLTHWTVQNPHPEISWQALFGKVWYEGYPAPAYVWQSTGGTDDFEPKLSLVPLIYGTLKGTFYSLILAVPLAVFGALYASQFMHPRFRGMIKPVIEIMAALPSVVLGLIAGLWLAPFVERVAIGVLLIPIVIPLLILLVLFCWRLFPLHIRRWLRPGTEVFFLLLVVLAGGWLSLQVGHVVEALLMGGDYRTWLLNVLGLTYDQRNSLVVGFAMGFAVIPIIFTIAEDALAGVPPHLIAGSLALGATRWQTALRVVLPTASPGIFSAIMIGFGRAIGETMIVLMATGNTPVMDWNIFSGFRALSATIAVELPEAPYGGTLYRVLFLAALLLFVMTFIVNTVAEVVRLRLRRRYQLL